ncbi:MAG: hypothetical protein IJP33_00885 [Firmicutes bacterium]|nr:hypothetical protein [Bacillota bacterium]
MNSQAEAFWKLFVETGSVKVYMCYKQLDEQSLSDTVAVKSVACEQTLS